MPSIYWPEEGTPDFVSHDDEQTWTPLCCDTEMTRHFTTMSNWRCDECGTLHLIWAEDWPDYDEDDH